MIRLSVFAFILSTTLIAAALPAQAGRIPVEEVHELAQPLVDNEWSKGLVVGLIDGEGQRVFSYGTMSSAERKVPDGDTIFEIGSVTKIFTGMLLAEMVGRGEVQLDDPISKYLPDNAKLPESKRPPITLAHLAMQNSGLPRMPGNLKPADPQNPYADYTVEQLYAFLHGYKLTRDPGAKYEYSNLGMGLLGHILALRAGKDYETLLTERILTPLGLQDTRIALDDAARKRLSSAHDADGEHIKNWDFPSLNACGGLRSTANDLLKLLKAAMDPETPAPLAKMIKLASTARAPAGPGNKIGLGWHMSQDETAVWHNGQTGGYHTYVAFVPERKVGVVVLANSPTGLVDEVGVALLRRLVDRPGERPMIRKTAKLEPAALDSVVGRFILMPGFALTITRDGERMFCQATGQPKARIYPQSATEYFFKAVDAQVTFKLSDAGRAYMLTLHQNGLNLPGMRADEKAAK